eukprot:ctg_168.g124
MTADDLRHSSPVRQTLETILRQMLGEALSYEPRQVKLIDVALERDQIQLRGAVVIDQRQRDFTIAGQVGRDPDSGVLSLTALQYSGSLGDIVDADLPAFMPIPMLSGVQSGQQDSLHLQQLDVQQGRLTARARGRLRLATVYNNAPLVLWIGVFLAHPCPLWFVATPPNAPSPDRLRLAVSGTARAGIGEPPRLSAFQSSHRAPRSIKLYSPSRADEHCYANAADGALSRRPRFGAARVRLPHRGGDRLPVIGQVDAAEHAIRDPVSHHALGAGSLPSDAGRVAGGGARGRTTDRLAHAGAGPGGHRLAGARRGSRSLRAQDGPVGAGVGRGAGGEHVDAGYRALQRGQLGAVAHGAGARLGTLPQHATGAADGHCGAGHAANLGLPRQTGGDGQQTAARPVRHRVNRLRARFEEAPLRRQMFRAEYARGIAADGFARYCEQVWQVIRENRELDIPTQKEALSRVRCEEIAREAEALFDAEADDVAAAYARVMDEYGARSSRYLPAIAAARREQLHRTLSAQARDVFGRRLAQATDRLIEGAGKMAEEWVTRMRETTEKEQEAEWDTVEERLAKAGAALRARQQTAAALPLPFADDAPWQVLAADEAERFQRALQRAEAAAREQWIRIAREAARAQFERQAKAALEREWNRSEVEASARVQRHPAALPHAARLDGGHAAHIDVDTADGASRGYCGSHAVAAAELLHAAVSAVDAFTAAVRGSVSVRVTRASAARLAARRRHSRRVHRRQGHRRAILGGVAVRGDRRHRARAVVGARPQSVARAAATTHVRSIFGRCAHARRGAHASARATVVAGAAGAAGLERDDDGVATATVVVADAAGGSDCGDRVSVAAAASDVGEW